MNKILIKSIFLYFLLCFLMLLYYPNFFNNNLELFVINFILSLSYLFLLVVFYNKDNNLLKVIIITLVFQIIFVSALTQLYLNINKHPFSFTASDSLSYDLLVRDYLHYSFFDSICLYFKELPIDDIGFPTLLSLLYRINPDPLFSRYFFILIICFSTIVFFYLCQFYLNNKFSYIATLAFSISNYSTLYASNGLKEHLMLLVLLISTYFLVKYLKYNKVKHLLISILISILLIFFRVPVVFFFLITSTLSIFFMKKVSSFSMVLMMIIIFASMYVLYSYHTNEINRFTEISSEESFERTSAFVSRSGLFTLFTAIISGLIGPLPTLVPKTGKEDVFFIGAALLFRSIIGLHILSTVVVTVKRKILTFYPIILYPSITIISLISISQVFEFRFHIIHFPLLIILGFYSIERKIISNKLFQFYYLFIAIIVLYWNFGRI